MLGMLLAIFAFAIGAAGFRNVDLGNRIVSSDSLKKWPLMREDRLLGTA